jgi:hypothetical protein
MKVQNVFTSGKMNKDADERLIPKGEYRDALNLKVANSEGSDVGSIENALSNSLQSYFTFGDNPICIGSIGSDTLKKVYWFIVSDSGSYIAEYDETALTNAAVIVLQDNSGILNFSADHRIHSTDIIIDTDNDKVFLYWTDNYNPPRKIEVEEAKGWSTFTDADISVIKAAPIEEPTIVGYNSSSYQDNPIEDKMFSFAYRYQYTHGEWSALSSFSELAFLAGTVDTDLTDDVNQGMQNTWNNIQVSYNNGGPEVRKVEVYAVENGKSTAYRVHVDNKPGIDNITQSFYFRNDKAYPVLSTTDFNKTYDNVPLKAATQVVIGNRLMYGNYEENYDIDTIFNFSLTHISSTITGGQAEKTLKAGHKYDVGFVYFDDYGRKSTVLSSGETSITFSANDVANKIRVNISHLAPSWATRYKFAVKSNVGLYETIRTEGPAYRKDAVMYVQMHQEDYNKLSEDRHILVKNNGQGRMATKYLFKFVEIYTATAGELYSGSAAGTYAKLETVFDVNELNNVFDWVDPPLVDPNQVLVDANERLIFESVEKTIGESAYYEVPGVYEITDRYHQGDVQSQSETQSTAIVDMQAYNAWCFGDGSESNKALDSQVELPIYMGVRVNEEIDDYKRTSRPSSITYSDVYEQSTGYNGLGSFNLTQLNYKDLDDQYGGIARLVSKDSDLISFQEDKVHKILINKNILYTASGSGSVSQSLSVLGQEVAYLGEYGINSSPDSVQVWRNNIFFADNRRGVICRIDVNGIFEISQYGMKRWFNDNISLDSGNEVIAGYDPYNDHYVASVGGQYTLTFSNDYKGWTSFYSYMPESMTDVGNNFYTFKSGQIYKHNIKGVSRNSFYAQPSANTEVEFIVNDGPSDVKIFKAVELEGNSGNWDITITTDLEAGHINNPSLTKKEGKYWAYIRRNQSDILNTQLLSVQGIGDITAIDGNTITFVGVPSTVRVGDSMYYYDGVDNLLLGSVTEKTATTVTVDTVVNTPSVSNFSFVAKNPTAESYGLKGYYASVRLTNDDYEPLELFAVNSEIIKSFM